MKNIADYFISPINGNSSNSSRAPLKSQSPLLSPKKPQKQDDEKNNRKKTKVERKVSLSTNKTKKSLTRSPSNVKNDGKSSKHKTKEKNEKISKLQLHNQSSNSSDFGVSSSKTVSQSESLSKPKTKEKNEEISKIQLHNRSSNSDLGSDSGVSFSKTVSQNASLQSPNSIKKSQKQDKEKNNKKLTKVEKKILLSTKKSKKSYLSKSPSNVENDEKKTKQISKLKIKLKKPVNSSNSDVISGNSLSQNESAQSPNSVKKSGIATEFPSKNADSQHLLNSTPFKKVNAFQFLMDSRNNVIGQNIEGKEVEDQSSSKKEEKERLDKRKSLFEEWAEKKGGAKRKREEIEVEKCINKKLDKRAKRLKSLLQGENSSSQDYKEFFKKKKKKIIRMDSSDSESNEKSVKEETVLECKSSMSSAIIDEDNAQDNIFTENIETRKQLKGKKENKVKENVDFKGLIPKNEIKSKDILESFPLEKPPKKRSRLSCLDNFCKPLDDSSQESQGLTPKRLKKWKLKIKLNDNVNLDNEDVKPSPKSTNLEEVIETLDVEVLDEFSQNSFKITNENSQETSDDTDKLQNITINSSESEDDKPLSNLVQRTSKIAPIFGKSKKIDEKTIQAKKDFLMSGVPDKLRKTVQKQKSFEERPHNVFPIISHIQQKCDHNFWHLPIIDLNLKVLNDSVIETTNLIYENLTQKDIAESKLIDFKKEVQKVHNLKATLQQIKQDNPDYPVFKAFRHIYEKSGKAKKDEETKSSKKCGRKSLRKSAESEENKKVLVCNKEYQMWTEKYKARCSEEILGNHTGVTKLKKWLETWMNYSKEINSRRREKRGYDSSSEFDTTDCDSQDDARLPGNTVIVGGPNGSGKTSAIYAIANEFGFNVLEVNATSRRTGKRLQQELQEATQSHQVRKKEIISIFNTKNSKPAKKSEEILAQKVEKKKMCILLIEDIDLIFDQDEGFFSSLTQLILTSKRPIILTTSDTGPNHIQKLLSQHEYISFAPLSLNTLAVWLQLVCLVEGLLVSQSNLGNLLEYNRGDIRKTLLEVQFWCQSGGQLNVKEVLPILTTDNSKNWEKHTLADEEFNTSLKDDINTQTKNFVHTNILGSFEIFKGSKPYSVSLDINLGTLWWNTPNIFNLDAPQRRLKETEKELSKENNAHNKLSNAMRYYDSLLTTDLLHTSFNHCSTMEPVLKDWLVELKDSLELSERMDGHSSLDFIGEVTHFLVDGCVEEFRKSEDFRGINMALPNSAERRWRAKQHLCEDFLKEPIPLSSSLERRSVTLDYLPNLRNIARSEKIRSTLNTKRGNRFRHYFRDLNMEYNDNLCKMDAQRKWEPEIK